MPRKKKLLFICGSINQTTQMHQIARELPEYQHTFSCYYGNLDFEVLRHLGILEYTIGGNKLRNRCLDYLRAHGLEIDIGGKAPDIDLVFNCSDLVRPKNIRDKKVILVQEGMTDPENFVFPIVQRFRSLDGWWAGTCATGLSDQYDRFCVASQGYRDLFVRRGIKPEKLVVTGIPNFDNVAKFLVNEFPLRGYVLVCTSDIREVFGFEDRKAFILKAREIAKGRQLVFKLHPNEKLPRATREIAKWAPDALVYTTGSAEEMVANCDVLVTQYSSLAHVGLALGKEVHSFFDLDELKRLVPLQNGCAAKNIANVARELLGDAPRVEVPTPPPSTREAPPPPSRRRIEANGIHANGIHRPARTTV
ncbi:MAG TPA: hypothetical protein VHB21_00370 [Minicystis sp.]|nr:hypothetical protein [Minicystis sp.]